MTTHLIIPDQHAHYQHNNNRASWLGQLIADIKPDVVINIGDAWDMPSLASYDKGKRAFQGRNYRADIEVGLDFQDRLWAPVRLRKRKLPRRVFCIGNHEERIARAIDLSPELDGAIGYSDLGLSGWYDEVVHYEGRTPGTIEIDGVTYAHYVISGIMGNAVSGEHPAYSLVTKRLASTTVGHSHLIDFASRVSVSGRRFNGLVCGAYMDFHADWAGTINRFWWHGVVVKRNVHEGNYDPEFISIDRIRNEYDR